MFDPTTATVAYDSQRGEPRNVKRQAGNTGDCIDCGICVQVCPTGIDIRDGLQYQCINCGLCIDGCDEVMDNIGAQRGLIRFASERELAGQPKPKGLRDRPRVAIYASLLIALTSLAAWNLSQRSLLLVDVLRDRGALLRETSDGRIENAYTLKLMNLDATQKTYRVGVSGLHDLKIEGESEFSAESGSIRPISITVSSPAEGTLSGIQPIHFEIVAVDDPQTRVQEKSSFVLP